MEGAPWAVLPLDREKCASSEIGRRSNGNACAQRRELQGEEKFGSGGQLRKTTEERTAFRRCVPLRGKADDGKEMNCTALEDL